MDYYIVTGASRGLGEALVRELLVPSNSIFCLARTVNDALVMDSARQEIELHWIQADLARCELLEDLIQSIAQKVDTTRARSITLINNAATVSPIGPVGHNQTEEIAQSIKVNLIAPMVLTSAFVRAFAGSSCPLTVVTISSGAAVTPMPGLSAYSTAKAGVNMFTRAAAEDYPPGAGSTLRFLAVGPGIVDTPMQEALRSADPARLRERDTYLDWKTGGKLASPRESARRVLSVLSRNDVTNGSYVPFSELTTEESP